MSDTKDTITLTVSDEPLDDIDLGEYETLSIDGNYAIDLDMDNMLSYSEDDVIFIDDDLYAPKLYVWKLWEDAHMPEYGSEWAACFDLKASLRDSDNVTVYNQMNHKEKRSVEDDRKIQLHPGERMLVPTGLVFDMKEGFSLRIHPRSGLSLKNGIVVANCEGVVDADYVQQTYVMLHNISGVPFVIRDGDRIAQAELVTIFQPKIVESDMEPEEKTSRKGGFGSTGYK